MKILYAYDQVLPYTGADAEQVFNTVDALSRLGVDIELVVPRPRHEEPMSSAELKAHYQVTGPFHVTALDTDCPLRVPEKLRHAWRLAHEPAYADRLIYTRHIPQVAAAVAAHRPVVYETYRAWPVQYPAMKLPLCSLLQSPYVRGCVFHSEYARESFERGGVLPSKLAVIHNGHSPVRMKPVLSQSEARALLGFDARRPLVVYAGRIGPKKGLELCLEIASRCPEIDFALVGSEHMDAPFGSIEALAAQHPNVKVFPWQPFDKTVPYLYAADILLIPPSLEPLKGATVLPMKLFLYLAAGRTIVAPKASDTRELLHDGINAALCTPGNPEIAAELLRDLIAHPDKAAQLAAGALETSANLTWDARAAKLANFLDSVAP